MKKIKSPLIIILICSSIISCSSGKIEAYSETSFALGTVCSITLYEKNRDFKFEEAFSIINDLENRMSTVIVGSELYNINSNASLNSVKVSKDTYYVIKEGIKYANLPGSKFDITIGPLVSLWGIGTDNQRLPEGDLIKAVLPLIGSEKIKINDENRSVFLEKNNMSIDLGGIAKGYAADIVRDFLLKRGFTKGIINLGGNVLTFGSKKEGIHWKIGIQNPIDSRGKYIGTLEIGESAVVTSGIYERFFEVGEKRYHHILDPDTGYPVDNDLQSISIVTPSGIKADAWSTLVFSYGLTEGMELLEATDNMEGIFITKDNKIYTSSGLKNSFKLLSPDFKLVL